MKIDLNWSFLPLTIILHLTPPIKTALAVFGTSSSSEPNNNTLVSATCIFDYEEFKLINRTYCCEPDRFHHQSGQTPIKLNLTGSHMIGKSNADVTSFKIDVHCLKYFPSDIDKFFPNIRVIYINDGPLAYLNQSDLKPFPQLHTLDLHDNRIEKLEIDLFKFNPVLEVVWLSDNRIYEAHPDIFDHLTKLSYLYLHFNLCISKNARGNRTEVDDVIKTVKSRCSPGFMTTPRPIEVSDEDEDEIDHFRELSHREREWEDDSDDNWRSFFDYQDEMANVRKKYATIMFFMSFAIFVLVIGLVGTCWLKRRGNSMTFGPVSMNRLMT